MTTIKPLIKWPGGKRRQAQLISSIIMAKDVSEEFDYYEPFLGGGALFMHLKQSGALKGEIILSDISERLIAFHTAIRDEPEAVIETLDDLRSLTLDDYYEVRTAFNEADVEGPETAAMFLWLNKNAWRGLWRENKSGGMNVPKNDKLGALPNAETIRAVSEIYQGVTLRCEGFSDAFTFANKQNAVFYCDPPYVPLKETETSFVTYSKQGFPMALQHELAALAREAAAEGAIVVISNHASKLATETLYPVEDFEQHFLKAKRGIGVRVDKTEAKEVIAVIGG